MFYLELTAKDDVVRKRFAHSYVYYAGSHEGCGCGYFKEYQDASELAERQQNYAALAGVASEAISRKADIEIFTCWEGEQMHSAKIISSVTPAMLCAPLFELQQLQLLKITDSN